MELLTEILAWFGAPAWVALLVKQTWSFFLVSLMTYYAMDIWKRLAAHRKWRGEGTLFDDTIAIHPFIFGGLLMQVPFPVVDAIDSLGHTVGWWPEMWSRGFYGGVAGALCGQTFEALQLGWRAGKRRVASFLGTRSTSSPPEPSTPALADELEPGDRPTPPGG